MSEPVGRHGFIATKTTAMKDPEVNEDKGLKPYQGELFANPESGRYMKFIPVKTRGEAKKEKNPTPSTKPQFLIPSKVTQIEFD